MVTATWRKTGQRKMSPPSWVWGGEDGREAVGQPSLTDPESQTPPPDIIESESPTPSPCRQAAGSLGSPVWAQVWQRGWEPGPAAPGGHRTCGGLGTEAHKPSSALTVPWPWASPQPQSPAVLAQAPQGLHLTPPCPSPAPVPPPAGPPPKGFALLPAIQSLWPLGAPGSKAHPPPGPGPSICLEGPASGSTRRLLLPPPTPRPAFPPTALPTAWHRKGKLARLSNKPDTREEHCVLPFVRHPEPSLERGREEKLGGAPALAGQTEWPAVKRDRGLVGDAGKFWTCRWRWSAQQCE